MVPGQCQMNLTPAILVMGFWVFLSYQSQEPLGRLPKEISSEIKAQTSSHIIPEGPEGLMESMTPKSGMGMQGLWGLLFKGGGTNPPNWHFFPIVPSLDSQAAELGVCMHRGTCIGRMVADPMGCV